MSDRGTGILKAVPQVWPEASHRFCARHIYANFRARYSDQRLQKLFWIASRSASEVSWIEVMQEIEALNPAARRFLDEIETSKWALFAMDPRIKCEHVTNNMTESLNHAIKEPRGGTYLGLMEELRKLMMTRIVKRAEACEQLDNNVAPVVVKKLMKLSTDGRDFLVMESGKGFFEVYNHKNSTQYIISLEAGECSCGYWQMSGIPCVHVVASLSSKFDNDELPSVLCKYVHPYLCRDAYKRTYDRVIHPVPQPNRWRHEPVDSLSPPTYKKQAGRPTKKRNREVGESPSATYHGPVICRNCKTMGHNKRTCPKNKTIPARDGAEGTTKVGQTSGSKPQPRKQIRFVTAENDAAGAMHTNSQKAESSKKKSNAKGKKQKHSAKISSNEPKEKGAKKGKKKSSKGSLALHHIIRKIDQMTVGALKEI